MRRARPSGQTNEERPGAIGGLHPRLQRDLFAYVEQTGMARDALLFGEERKADCISNTWFTKKIWRPAIKRAACR